MALLIGMLLILWGMVVLYSSLFKMKKRDYSDTSAIGVSGYIELEFLFKLFSRLSPQFMKGITLLIGVAFLAFGSIIIL